MRQALVYIRLSRDREGAGLGIDRQRGDCEDLAERLGWAVVAVHADNDISAYSGKPRPGYRQLLDDLRHDRANAVIAWHTDRLHRSPRELEEYVDICEAHGVATHTVKAGALDLSTPSGRMIARQLGAVARFEVEHMIERAQSAKLQAATSGQWKGGRRPFGFEPDGVTVRDDEAREVAEAAKAVLAGMSLHAIARGLNARGVRTSTGRGWATPEIRRVLLRPRNAGLMEHRGEVIGDAGWPAIVDEDRWRAVVAMLTDPSRRTAPLGGQRRWLGSGLYLCEVCGGTLSGGRSDHGRPVYRCRSRKHVTRDARHLDDLVERLVIARLQRPDAAALVARDPVDTTPMHAEALTLRQRLDDLAAMYADGGIDARQLREGSDRLHARLVDIEHAIGAAARTSEMAGLVGAADVAKVWHGLDLSRRRAVVAALIEVTVMRTAQGRRAGGAYFDPAGVRVEWKSTT